jgi:hypothetical protein
MVSTTFDDAARSTVPTASSAQANNVESRKGRGRGVGDRCPPVVGGRCRGGLLPRERDGAHPYHLPPPAFLPPLDLALGGWGVGSEEPFGKLHEGGVQWDAWDLLHVGRSLTETTDCLEAMHSESSDYYHCATPAIVAQHSLLAPGDPRRLSFCWPSRVAMQAPTHVRTHTVRVCIPAAGPRGGSISIPPPTDGWIYVLMCGCTARVRISEWSRTYSSRLVYVVLPIVCAGRNPTRTCPYQVP